MLCGNSDENGNAIRDYDTAKRIRRRVTLQQKQFNIKYKALNFSELYDRIKSVAIFGHSLGETDHTYFNKLFQESCMYNKFSTNNNKEFWLFYYKENGYHCMMQQLDSLTHNSLTSFRQYNRVNFINTDKEKVFI